MWRPVCNPQVMQCTLTEVLERWTIDDLLDAHFLIDHFEAQAEEQRRKNRAA